MLWLRYVHSSWWIIWLYHTETERASALLCNFSVLVFLFDQSIFSFSCFLGTMYGSVSHIDNAYYVRQLGCWLQRYNHHHNDNDENYHYFLCFHHFGSPTNVIFELFHSHAVSLTIGRLFPTNSVTTLYTMKRVAAWYHYIIFSYHHGQ